MSLHCACHPFEQCSVMQELWLGIIPLDSIPMGAALVAGLVSPRVLMIIDEPSIDGICICSISPYSIV